MKKLIYAVTMISFTAVFFGFKADLNFFGSNANPKNAPADIWPAIGCRYTGYYLDSCSAVSGATIWNCTDVLMAINCGYDPSKPIEEILP